MISNKNSQRGSAAVIVIAAVVVVGSVFFFGKRVFDSLPFFRHAPSSAAVALETEKASAAKTGQQFAAATTKEVALAKDQTDPAIIAAKKTAARADSALNAGLGAFTVEQAQWVENLVEADAAGFTAALASKDQELADRGNRIAVLEKSVAEEGTRSGWFAYLLLLIVGLVIFIYFILPALEKLFPPLGLFISGIHAVFNPWLAMEKNKAKALFGQLGQAVTDIRSKLGAQGAAAIAQLDVNLDAATKNAIANAATAAAAQTAADQAAAAAKLQIASS